MQVLSRIGLASAHVSNFYAFSPVINHKTKQMDSRIDCIYKSFWELLTAIFLALL